jgi:dodecin
VTSNPALGSPIVGWLQERRRMAAVKIIELIGTSQKSSDDAVQQALSEARTSLRNIKAVDVVSTGLRGDNLDEWRAHVRVAFLVERVSE